MHFLGLLLALFAQVSLYRRSIDRNQFGRKVSQHRIKLRKRNEFHLHDDIMRLEEVTAIRLIFQPYMLVRVVV